MKRAASIFFLTFFLALFLPGCATPKRIVVFSESYWRELTDRDPDFKATLERESARQADSLAFIDAPQGANYFEDLRRSLQKTPADLVITGPLLCNEDVRIAPLFPQTKFTVLDMPRIDSAIPPNVIPVYSQRGAAFREAGRLTAAALADPRLTALGKKVGIILSGLTQTEKEMYAEFERGFSTAGETNRLVVEELETVSDRVRAARAVEDLLNQDVKLFFVKAYGLNGACLERIAAAGAYFMMEDFPTFNLHPEKLLLSIEDDYVPALTALLQSKNFFFHTPPVLTAKIVKGDIIKDLKVN
jgi:hypothetical protein